MFFWSITLINIEKRMKRKRTKLSVQSNHCGNSLERRRRRKKSTLFTREYK
jgi:hypothetical protein